MKHFNPSRFAALASVTLLSSVVLAAPPAVSTTTKGDFFPTPKGEAGLTGKVAKPRSAAFASALYPDIAPSHRTVAPPAPSANLPEGFEVVVFAPHRPIRIKVAIQYEGKPLAERWTEALRQAFKGFDRDGDGFLNGYETQYIFSDLSLAQLLQSAYYAPNPTNLPTLDKLDLDRDRRVSFDEFAAYYKTAANRAVQAFPPLAEAPFNAETTEALFKLMDQNGDGKLTRSEVLAVEQLLASKDADEDECLSATELVGNVNFGARYAGQPFAASGRPTAARVPQNVVVFKLDNIPGTITQRILKDYDKDKDSELTQAECGFDDATFARLDLDRNGKLTGEELDLYRTGSADFAASLSLAPKAVDCKVTVTTDAKLFASRGFTMKAIESGRMVVHHGRQPIELWSFAAVVQNGRGLQLKQSYGGLFLQLAGTRGYIEEKDFAVGQNAVSYQQLRVLFDPADFNSDGKLTKEEFDKYFDLQQPFFDLGLGLTPAVQTPTLFQLLDENRDGRLGVREIRTAWNRLITLEPSGPGASSEVVTRAAIQPSVSLRLSRTFDRATINQLNDFPNQNQVAIPQKGPTWFRKMDRNGDGDVSRAEFLGTRAEFDAMDADHDGLISLEEAEAFEKAARK